MTRTVLFTTNYPMAEARRLWRAGTYPGFHLFGTAHLERDGWTVVDLPEARLGRTRASAAAAARLGAVGAEVAALRRAGPGAVLYAADPVSFAGLALLRSVGRCRSPVVAVVHPQVVAGDLRLRALRAYDVVIALSKKIHHELVHDVGRPAARTLWAPPGPDTTFPLYEPLAADRVVSSGKTLRDEPTLAAALQGVAVPATVHTARHPGDVVDGSVTWRGRAPYQQVLDDLRRASVVAIPLSRPSGTFGLTELNDALALAKPIILTRNPYLDVDLASVGCGWFVDPGDTAGWRRALTEAADDPAGAAERGRAGRRYVDTSWNWDLFAEAVRAAMEMVAT